MLAAASGSASPNTIGSVGKTSRKRRCIVFPINKTARAGGKEANCVRPSFNYRSKIFDRSHSGHSRRHYSGADRTSGQSFAAAACVDNGVTSFNRVRYRHHDESIFLYAFDLIELNGDDLRRNPLETRKITLEIILAKAWTGIRFNEHMEGDGETVFWHACKVRLEGIASKRKDLAHRSGRSPDWLKVKNADAPAVRREEEKDWAIRKWR
jgi:ATP dependent DNA ligase-like protein